MVRSSATTAPEHPSALQYIQYMTPTVYDIWLTCYLTLRYIITYYRTLR